MASIFVATALWRTRAASRLADTMDLAAVLQTGGGAMQPGGWLLLGVFCKQRRPSCTTG